MNNLFMFLLGVFSTLFIEMAIVLSKAYEDYKRRKENNVNSKGENNVNNKRKS